MDNDVHFEGWTLRRPSGELVRGPVRRRLQGQPLQVLEALLEQPGELVTRDQLIARLWSNGVIVDFDTALNSAVRRLRTALDDHAESPRYIETVPRRGYRFIGAVGGVTHPTASPSTVQSSPVPVFAASSPVARNHRPTTRQVLVVTAVALVALGVTATAWLQRPTTSARLAGKPVPQAMAVSAEGRELYERGRFFLRRRDSGDTGRAVTLFEQALHSDPGYADAWAGIAGARWLDTVQQRVPLQEGLALTRAAAERALTLDPANAEALLRLANYHQRMGDAATAGELRRRALAVAPQHPLVLTFEAGDAAGAGRFDAAIELQRRAVQLDPLAVTTRHNLAVWLFLAGHFDAARDELEKIVALNPPRRIPHGMIGQTLLLQGNPTAALQYAQTLPAGVEREQLEALAHFALGHRDAADAALTRLARQVPDRMAYLVAEVHAFRGEPDAAFAWLQRYGRPGSASCMPEECWTQGWVPVLPLLQPLRSDPRWDATRTLLVSAPGPSITAGAGERQASRR